MVLIRLISLGIQMLLFCFPVHLFYFPRLSFLWTYHITSAKLFAVYLSYLRHSVSWAVLFCLPEWVFPGAFWPAPFWTDSLLCPMCGCILGPPFTIILGIPFLLSLFSFPLALLFSVSYFLYLMSSICLFTESVLSTLPLPITVWYLTTRRTPYFTLFRK